MRRLLSLSLLILSWSIPALADESPPRTEPSAPQRTRVTTEQRFQAANTTRDGRLTLEQAKQGYKVVARNFKTIDATGKGFVTLEDVRTWQKALRDARSATRAAAEDPLRPRPALQRTPAPGPAPTPNTPTPITPTPVSPTPVTPTPATPAPATESPIAIQAQADRPGER